MDKILIVTLHGICSNIDASDAWQMDFNKWLKANYAADMTSKTLVHLPFSYGIIGPVWAFIINTMAWVGLSKFVAPFAAKLFRTFLTATARNYPDYKVHIVAHSFGSWVSHEVLRDNSRGPWSLKIEGYHLFGAVISAHIQKNWLDELLMSKQAQYCVVWSSRNDTVVRYLAVPPFGHLGYWGIIRDYHPEDRVKPTWQPYDYLRLYNRVIEYGHNECLTPATFPKLMEDIQNEPKTENT
jgi:pimeloyl-ACP methyl ester carboxylesterase